MDYNDDTERLVREGWILRADAPWQAGRGEISRVSPAGVPAVVGP